MAVADRATEATMASKVKGFILVGCFGRFNFNVLVDAGRKGKKKVY